MTPLYGISAKRTSWKYSEDTVDKIESELAQKDAANQLTFKQVYKLQARQKKAKKKPYNPESIFCTGNHDDRARLYWEFNRDDFKARYPKMKCEDWLGFNRYYNKVFGFQYPAVIEGIVFSHNFVNGTSQASTVDGIIKIAAQSAVGFHSHKAEFKASQTATGRPIYGLQAGWFFDPDDKMLDWVGPMGGSDWTNTVVMLHGMDGSGYFEPEFISTKRLLKEYL
jgi:hypothetical protein